MHGGAPSVSVLYFAALRDLSGVGEESVELPDGLAEGRLCVEQLLTELERRHPALSGRLLSRAVRVAVNEEFVEVGKTLQIGDVVALIPPVSGG